MLTRPDVAPTPDSAALPDAGTVIVHFEGRAIAARPGDSIAAALLAGGITATRNTPVSGGARGPFCMMGACFDCLAAVDGRPNVQTCMTPVRDGMRIERQDGARGLAIEAVGAPFVPSAVAAASRLDPSPQPPPSRGGGE